MAIKTWMKSLSVWFLNFILNEAVFWCTVVVLITTTAVIVGFQLQPGSRPAPKPEDQETAFQSLLWAAILQLLLNYCTVVPVIREQGQRPANQIIQVNYIIFYGSVTASVVATILAPVLLRRYPESNLASSIANFTSNVFSAVAASQLAAGDHRWASRSARSTAEKMAYSVVDLKQELVYSSYHQD
ncbi:hypothetical protein PG995_012092 [Apiospora arundinis]